MTAQAAATQIVELPIAQLKLIDEYQVRMATDRATCVLYSENMLEGSEFPPLEAVKIGDDILLVDGRHRREALLMIGKTTALVKVTEGDEDYAMMRACAANAHHPRNMNIADKRNAVTKMLLKPAFNDPAVWTDRRLAKLLGVSHVFVGGLRETLYPAIHEERQVAREIKKAEREVPQRPTRDSMLDHADAPIGLPEPIAVESRVSPNWRANAPARPRATNGSNGLSNRVAALPPAAPALPNHNAVAGLPIGSAIAARLKGRAISFRWSDLDEDSSASISDLGDVPDDVLALAYQAIGEEIQQRTKRL